VEVLRVSASHECGRIVHEKLADSQVIGGIVQGIGFALMERRIVDAGSGRVMNANLEDYKVPTIADTPAIHHARLDLPDLLANRSGAKGLGEPPIIPTAPAITNAIFDAVGVRIYDLPVDTCSMLEALSGPPRTQLCHRKEASS
jgi:xanthine dehydrogenase YagR molybdenum-binding subunit